MALVSFKDVSFTYGGSPILSNINLNIQPGEKICLLGRNGCGKSTLLKLINGVLKPDSGQIAYQPSIRITELIQQVPAKIKDTVFNVVTTGMGKEGILVSRYHEIAEKISGNHDPALIKQLEQLGHELDLCNGWKIDQFAGQVISEMNLQAQWNFNELSAGLKRRVLLAKALICQPDVLLLDEPTNHLDIDSIQWIESFFESWKSALVFVTHDRDFIRKLSTRILEIDRKQLFSYGCNYETYLKRKEDILNTETKHSASFDKVLAQEEAWIRQGIQGRRTRNEGRVKALKELREEKKLQLKQKGNIRIQVQQAAVSGRLIFDIKDLCFKYDDKPIIENFTSRVLRGDKIGIIGANGSGKTTLLELLLKEKTPDKGIIKYGTKLQIAYFDQLHNHLDEEKSVMDNVSDGYYNMTINGKSKHVLGYLNEFLFTSDMAKQPASRLSGGEKNRLLLAKLFAKPSNLLVMDEPTNDLDIETLELLEEMLMDYNGTVLLVSHDRAFLNNVVTGTFALEEGGIVKEYAGGYDDYLFQRKNITPDAVDDKPKARPSKPQTSQKKKLNYRQQQELKALPDHIESLEGKISDIHNQMTLPDFYKNSSEFISKTANDLKDMETQLEILYNRWEELSDYS